MQRLSAFAVLFFLGLGFWTPPVLAEENPHKEMKTARAAELRAVREEIERLRQQADALTGQREALLQKEIEVYLQRGILLREEVGPTLVGVSISAYVTSTALATACGCPTNTHAVNGITGLEFNFELTDNLDLFIDVTASTSGGFPSAFGPMAGVGGATVSGLFDGIGVDGTVSTSPGSARVYEAGIHWSVPIRDGLLHVMAGKLDPRNYFAQNDFAGDAHTQFLNNLFDDPPAFSWPTTSSGTTILGVLVWMKFGSWDQYRVDVGWFNVGGQFFNKGVAFAQFTWSTQVLGRDMNVRVYGQFDTRYPDAPATTDVSPGLGVSVDWWVTDRIGVFLRGSYRSNITKPPFEFNFVDVDYQAGAVMHGPFSKRPDDTVGIAAGYIKGPIGRAVSLSMAPPENHELVIEVYYRFMFEEGSLQISPMAQFIMDPGAGYFADPDRLILVGVRIHVPF